MSDPASPWAVDGVRESRIEPLEGEHATRFAIVGGGFTGLALALHLAREVGGERVRVLERGRLGAGASTRNSGMIGPGVWGPYHRLVARLGNERARATFAATEAAVREATALIAREGLDAELVRGRQCKVASSTAGRQALQAEARALRADGFDVGWLEGDALGRPSGASRYLAALVYPDTATVQPWRLLRSLRERLERLGVRLHEHSAVRSLRTRANGVTLDCAGGTLTAERVVLATNAALPELGALRHRVFPVAAHLMRTPPLPADALRRLGLDERTAVIENRRIFNYFRLTTDARLVFGGGRPFVPAHGATTSSAPTRRGRAALERELRRLFPDVPELSPERLWSGVMGFTIDNWPVLADVGDARVVAAGAWCGHGLALSLGGGRTLAARLLGQGDPRNLEPPWFRERAPLVPPGPWLRPSLAAYIASLHALDVRDALQHAFGARRTVVPADPAISSISRRRSTSR